MTRTFAIFASLAFTMPVFAQEDTENGNYVINGCQMFAQGTFNQVDGLTELKGWECVGAIEGIMFMGEGDKSLCRQTTSP
jgi:hypothetical protein